jgi:hypothetical protein
MSRNCIAPRKPAPFARSLTSCWWWTITTVAALRAAMTFRPLDIEEILTLTHRMMEASGQHGAS